MARGKPKKCWYCAKLGKCTKLQPCEDFVWYYYADCPPYTVEKVAKLCNVCSRTIYRYLAKDIDYALWWIEKWSGLKLDYVKGDGSKYMFVKREE